MQKKAVSVIFGGRSSEHEISKLSAATIINNISKDKYDIIPIYITKTGIWKIYTGGIDNFSLATFEQNLEEAIISPSLAHSGIIKLDKGKFKIIKIDVVFLAMHGKYGEDGTIQGLLELANIPYVGANVLSSAICMDKAFTKIIVENIGINQAKFKIITKNDLLDTNEIEEEIGYPCYIKPANGGSSIGVTKAEDLKSLKDAIDLAFKYDNKIIIEKNIIGREVECAILGNDEPKTASKIGEIITDGYYDFDAKYKNDKDNTCFLENIEEDALKQIKNNAIKIFKALDVKGLARVDFFIENSTGRIIFNEINTLPGFTDISMYYKLFKEDGMSLTKLIDTLINLAFENFENKII